MGSAQHIHKNQPNNRANKFIELTLTTVLPWLSIFRRVVYGLGPLLSDLEGTGGGNSSHVFLLYSSLGEEK